VAIAPDLCCSFVVLGEFGRILVRADGRDIIGDSIDGVQVRVIDDSEDGPSLEWRTSCLEPLADSGVPVAVQLIPQFSGAAILLEQDRRARAFLQAAVFLALHVAPAGWQRGNGYCGPLDDLPDVTAAIGHAAVPLFCAPW
jgi:hypothetical protein